MTWFSRRCLALGLVLLASVMLPMPRAGVAAPLATTEPVFGVATGATDSEGDMLPTGNGRFTIDDRVYVGKSLGRSVASLAAACFTGDLRSVEEWRLETPQMVGAHESTVTIRSERGAMTLRLRGQMEQMTASGTWQIVRASGACGSLDGNGTYTAVYSSSSTGASGDKPDFRLTFDGETQV
jgi:hypothetical protein